LHIHFTVENDIISANNGSYLLDINAGRGQIKNISQKSFLIIDVHGLNNLIWGFRSAWDLARMGHIQGSAQDIDNLAQAFPLCNNFLYEES
ncbi:MAG: sterol carrier protein domain-containing protein, partial [Clostridiales bacterium]